MEFEKKTTHTVEFSEMELYGICELLEHVRNEVDVDDYEYGLINSFLTGAGYEKKTEKSTCLCAGCILPESTEITIKANRHGTKLPYPDAAPRYPGYPQEEDLITDIMKEKNY